MSRTVRRGGGYIRMTGGLEVVGIAYYAHLSYNGSHHLRKFWKKEKKKKRHGSFSF